MIHVRDVSYMSACLWTDVVFNEFLHLGLVLMSFIHGCSE